MAAATLHSRAHEQFTPGAELALDRSIAHAVESDVRTATIHARSGMLDDELGSCRYGTVGSSEYQVSWGTYTLRRGMSWSLSTSHSSVALYCQLSGSMEPHTNSVGADVALHSGQSALVTARADSISSTLTRTIEGESFEVLLSTGYVSQLAARHPELLNPIAEAMATGNASVVGAIVPITPRVTTIIARVRQERPESLLLESAILELIALQLTAAPVPHTSRVQLRGADIERIHAARDLLISRLDDPPTLAELARHALTNEFKLKQGFRAIFGTSPYAYLLDHRMEHARRLLLDTDLPVAAIGRRIGYSDPAHFTNAFRRRFGHPPTHLRTRHQMSVMAR